MNVLHLYISPQHNFVGHHGQPAGETPIEEVPSIECVAGSGIQGDRFFNHKPDFKGQVTFFDYAVYERLCHQFDVHDKSPAVFRRNVVVEGVDLNSLIGKEFEVQGLRFFGTEESAPCYWMNQAFHEGAEKALQGHGGLRTKILTDGTLRSIASEQREA
jgi:MOSC domain-containing protein YiiM